MTGSPAVDNEHSPLPERLRGRGYPSLELHIEVFPEDFHVTVALLNLPRGLRYPFDALR